MKASEPLKAEHGGIKQILRILDAICKRLESGADVNPDHLEQIVEFLTVFVDKCHHAEEEDILFPAFKEAGVAREGDPIGVLLADHEMGRSYVSQLRGAIGRYESGRREAATEIVRNARSYMTLLIDHIERENNVLYVLADARLSEEKQNELVEGFETIERERIGAGRHEEFHVMIMQLSQFYLK